MARFRLLDKYLRRYTQLSERELSHQLQTNLWFTPVLYIVFSFVLLALSYTADYKFQTGERMWDVFAVDYDLTQALVSTLTAATLTLTTFTFNLILVVFTTFSGQFSPRILKNFIASKATQRILGIFTGSFFYMLFSFLVLNKHFAHHFFTVPLVAVLLASLSMGTFIFFINHAVAWLQVNKMTYEMKKESMSIVKGSLQNEIDPYKVKDTAPLKEYVERLTKREGKQISSNRSGYIQLIDFVEIMEEAKKDDIIIKLEYTIGDYVFSSTPILSYWSKEDAEIDIPKYLALFSFGKRQTEVQDMEFSINKLVEVAIRSVGNYDPKTASNAINQLGELLSYISCVGNLNPYLVDVDGHLRVILQEKDFSYYLYNGLGYIRHYSEDNVIVGIQILNVLDLIAKSANPRDYDAIWEFAVYTTKGYEKDFLFGLDCEKFNNLLYEIAKSTGHEKDFQHMGP
ncbi:Uncharacterized membrane protein [Fictibacillus enclensis]|uniref:DUF2254 domain-containing protein n=1 Tax=Fictibacillus enclensis TaxID=1017270 RepID=A0A0V8JBX7_9BACL|nr:DUF2254 domain-containing protein [Fictibacillus enclensis]KSU84360.1 hypothetical protein AS030_02015 [Fictibacillus enclensis]SCB77853.1 Uncharacterized membrane protein [Fictibacillus enclensis]